jgi:transcription initiation factor IIE alpha subunit
MNKLSSDTFRYTMYPHADAGVVVLLRKVEQEAKDLYVDRKAKEFYVAEGSVAGMTDHMNTLTDEQCAAWFPCTECGELGRHKKTCSKRKEKA